MIKSTLIIAFIIFIAFDFYCQDSTASRSVSTFEIKAPQLNSKKRIWIYLPKGYDISTEKYPVIYMHDAQNLFDIKTSYAGEWEVDETLDRLQAKIIVVGIEHGGDNRIKELAPFVHPKYGGGGADEYLEFIVKTLKPIIDQKYRTKTSSKNTCMTGSSLGGLLSFYAVLKYPKVFGKAAIFSPSFWYSEEIFSLMKKAPKLNAKMYFMCGDNEDAEMVPNMERMYKLIDKNRCYCLKLSEKKIVIGGQHNEKLWRENFEDAVKWLF